MKKLAPLLLWIIAVAVTPVLAQDTNQSTSQPAKAEPTPLYKFDLDFPGGTPGELVAAIQKASGHPLNAIIPDRDAATRLPSLKMRGVDVAQLFKALESTFMWEFTSDSSGFKNRINYIYCFKTVDKPSNDSIWCFLSTKQLPPEVKHSQFFNLSKLLEHGLTVDDITTAIQTGWKMAGVESSAELSFHKETKLLIVVGNFDQLLIVERALSALDKSLQPAAEKKVTPKDKS